MSSSLTLTLTIAGQIGSIPIETQTLSYALSGQTAGTGPKSVNVPAAAAPGSVEVCMEPMSEQNVLVLIADKEATYELNGDGVYRTINEDGFAVLPGGPVTAELAFGGNGTNDANITMLQLGLAGAPSTAIGGAMKVESLAAATPGQTVFTLTETPANPLAVMLFIDGVMWPSTHASVTVSNNTVTWSGAALSGGERIDVAY